MAKPKDRKPAFTINPDTDFDSLLQAMDDGKQVESQSKPREPESTPAQAVGGESEATPPRSSEANNGPSASNRKQKVKGRRPGARAVKGVAKASAEPSGSVARILDPARGAIQGDPVYIDASTKTLLRYVAHHAADDLPIGQLADRILKQWFAENKDALIARTVTNPLAAL